jgi:hypothetical protein
VLKYLALFSIKLQTGGVMKRFVILLIIAVCVLGLLTGSSAKRDKKHALKHKIERPITRDTNVHIGDLEGSIWFWDMPIDYSYKNSMVQTIYLSSEINTTGWITKLTYYGLSHFGNVPADEPLRVWLGVTERNEFDEIDEEWVPMSNFVLVFDSSLPHYPAGEFTAEIELDPPYEYTGGNLVVMTNRMGTGTFLFGEGMGETEWLQMEVDGNRSFWVVSNGEAFQPEYFMPTASTVDDLWIMQYIPNITLTFGEPPVMGGDLVAVSISGPLTSNTFVKNVYTVAVRNDGLEPAENFSVTLQLDNCCGSVSVTNPETPLEPGETLSFEVGVEFEESGVVPIRGNVEYGYDGDTSNNTTEYLPV